MKNYILYILIFFPFLSTKTKDFFKKIKDNIFHQKKNIEKKIDYLNFFKKEDSSIFEKKILGIFNFVKPGTNITEKIIDDYIIIFNKELKDYFNDNKIEFILSEDEIKKLFNYLNDNFLKNYHLENSQLLSYFLIFLANIYKKNKKIKEIGDFINLLENELDFKNKNFPILQNLKNEKNLKDFFFKIIFKIIKEKNKRIDENLLYFLSKKFSDSLIKNAKKIYLKNENKNFCEVEYFEKKLKNKKNPVLIEKISKNSDKKNITEYFLFLDEKVFENLNLIEFEKENFKIYNDPKKIINNDSDIISIFGLTDELILLMNK